MYAIRSYYGIQELGSHFIIISGEEAGPASNKMGGIWNVIHEEAHTLAALFDSGKLKKAKEDTEILVAGPYFGHRGADWNRGLNRITDMNGLAPRITSYNVCYTKLLRGVYFELTTEICWVDFILSLYS